MKIAICATEARCEGVIDSRFGRAAFFAVYDDAADSWEFIENAQNLQAAQGAGIQSAQHLLDAGADVLLTCHLGPKAARVLLGEGVSVFQITPGLTLTEAAAAYKGGTLEPLEQSNVEGHWV